MSEEQKLNTIHSSVIGVAASQDQIISRLDSIDKRLSGIEVKMGQVEKWIA